MTLKISGDLLLEMLNVEGLLSQLEKGFKDYVAGRVMNPLRTSITKDTDWWGVMPSYNPDVGFCVKAVCVLPANRLKGLPTTRATTLFFNPADGGLQAIFDGTILTAIRTAGSTALFFRYTSQPRSLFFFGTGLQARFHAKILSACFKIDCVNAHSRSSLSVEAFLKECADLGLRVDTKLRAEEAEALIVATTSTMPVVFGFGANNKYIASIGAPTPDARELADRVLAESSKVVVDTAEGCLKEAGDIVQTLKNGSLAAQKVVELGHLIATNTKLSGQRLVYKSVGSAFMDLYSCDYFYRQALRHGLGEEVSI